MATARTLLVLAMAAAALVGTTMGASYTVGAPGGSWDLKTNYATWASALTFRAGDQLVFTYSPAAHDVVEVSKADYDSCSASSPIATLKTGNDIVPLTAAGSRYFICGVPGHCDGGMKVQVNVEAAGSAGSAPSPVSTPAASGPASTPAARGPAAAAAPSAPSSSAESVHVGFGLGAVIAAALMLTFN